MSAPVFIPGDVGAFRPGIGMRPNNLAGFSEVVAERSMYAPQGYARLTPQSPASMLSGLGGMNLENGLGLAAALGVGVGGYFLYKNKHPVLAGVAGLVALSGLVGALTGGGDTLVSRTSA